MQPATATTAAPAAADVDALCQQWAAWCLTRRYYTAPPIDASLLARLSADARPRRKSRWPNAVCSAELAAVHLAVLAQPISALDMQIFALTYTFRVRNVKAAASGLGVSRQHWYRLLAASRARVYAASREILAHNLAAGAALPSRQMAVA